MNKSFSRHFQGDRKSELRDRIAVKKALVRASELPQGSEFAKWMKAEDVEQLVDRIRRT